jgi:hypothetical protein
LQVRVLSPQHAVPGGKPPPGIDAERSISYVIGPQSRLRDDEAQARVWMKKAAAMSDIGANMWLTDHP